MNFSGFIGPTYTPLSTAIDCELSENWYTEKVASGQGRGPYALLRTPGLTIFADARADGVTGQVSLFSLDNHLFAVAGGAAMEIFFNGSYNIFGAVANNGTPARMAGNPEQLFIVVAGTGYIAEFGALHQITDPGFPTDAYGAAFVGSRFLTARAGTQEFQASELNDGNTWDPVNVFTAEALPDSIAAIGSLNNEFWPFGSQTIQVFDDTGDLDQLFAPREDVVVNYGIYAPESLTNVGGDWYFISGSNRGRGIVMRMANYGVQRVSDHSVENAMRLMTNSADAVGWTYEENGHIFYVLYFKTDNQTWVYDVSVGQWHNRSWRNPTTNARDAHRGYSAASAFGKILVGDRENGLIYEMSMSYLDDAGDLIHRIRRSPCLDSELNNISHANLELDGNKGLGPDGLDVDDPNYSTLADPMGMLRWSDDGQVKSWSSEYWRGFGKHGEHDRRAIWRRLGVSRARTYEFSVSAAVDWMINGCYINKKK